MQLTFLKRQPVHVSEDDSEPVNHKPPEYADEIERNCDFDIILHIPAIRAKQDQQTDAGTDQQAGHHLTGGQDSLQIELGNCDGSPAVRNQTDQP